MRLSKNFYNLIVISYKIIPKNLKIGEVFMKRDWKEYNKQLVKRGEIIIDEDIFLSENTLPSKIQKAGRPKTYSDSLILFALTLKFTLSIPYRQLEGLITSLFKSLGAKVKNSKL
jgi:hypothetical protein